MGKRSQHRRPPTQQTGQGSMQCKPTMILGLHTYLGPVPSRLLVLLNGSFVDNCAGSHSNMVILGENPAIEVW